MASSAFELDRFVVGDDRLEITGRWVGVRGRRFIRPNLSAVVDGHETRALADLEHKPWAPTDTDRWIAAFPWSGSVAEAEDFELSVAPDLTVKLPPPDPASSRGRAREVLLEALAPDAPATSEPVRAERGRSEPPRSEGPVRSEAPLRPEPEPHPAVAERDQAIVARDRAAAERQNALTVRDHAIAERDRLESERDALRVELGRVRSQLRVARSDVVLAQTEVAHARGELTQVRAALERARDLGQPAPPEPSSRPPTGPPAPPASASPGPPTQRPARRRIRRSRNDGRTWSVRALTITAIAGAITLLLITVLTSGVAPVVGR